MFAGQRRVVHVNMIFMLFVVMCIVQTTTAAVLGNNNNNQAVDLEVSTTGSMGYTLTTLPPSSPTSNLDSLTSSPSPSLILTPGDNWVTIDELHRNMRTLWTFGFTIMQFHFLGTIYVMIRTYLRWKRTGVLSMAHRFPFYLSTLDLCLYFLYYFNGIPVLTEYHTLEPAGCRTVSGLIFYVVSANMTLAGTVSVVTYLRVCRQIHIDWGKYDWRLITFSLISPIVLTCIALSSFGSDTYWCYANRQNKAIAVINLLLNFSILGVACFCYFNVISAVSQSKKALAMDSMDTRRRIMNIDNRVVLKIFSYILIFLLNWSPSAPYVIGQVVDWAPFNIYIVTMLANCWGGILNAIQYMFNEGIWESVPITFLPRSSDSDPSKPSKDKSVGLKRQVPPTNSTSFSVDSTILFHNANAASLQPQAPGANIWRPPPDWEGPQKANPFGELSPPPHPSKYTVPGAFKNAENYMSDLDKLLRNGSVSSADITSPSASYTGNHPPRYG